MPTGRTQKKSRAPLSPATHDGCKSIGLARKQARAEPADANAILTLSKAYHANGQLSRALTHSLEAERLAPKSWRIKLHIATILREQNVLVAALDKGLEAASLAPGEAEVYLGLGATLIQLRRPRDAAQVYAKAVQIEPRDAMTYLALAEIFSKIGELPDAEKCFDLYLAFSNGAPDGQRRVAVQLLRDGHAQAAANRLTKLTKAQPDNAAIANNLGLAFRMLGKRSDAVKHLSRACQIAPQNATYRYNLSTCAAATELDGALRTPPGARPSSAFDRACMEFASAKWLEDEMQYQGAFETYEAANSILSHAFPVGAPPKPPNAADWSDPDMQGAQNCAIRPIFVVGLPRTGTTLIETVIADTFGAIPLGERTCAIDALMERAITGRSFHEAYAAYLPNAALRGEAFVDKMPLNYAHIGQIATALPQARFVHISRDCRAAGWSIYKHFFTDGGPAMRFSTSRTAILDQIRHHNECMSIWLACFGSRILALQYEAVVADPAAAKSALADYLRMDPVSPNEVKGARAVQTASALQASGPIHTGANDAWRRFEAFAPDWFAALGALNKGLPNPSGHVKLRTG